MASIGNLDSQQLVGMLKAKFGKDLKFTKIKSIMGKGKIKDFANKGEITADFRDSHFKILFDTDYEFSSISFFKGINEDFYYEFMMLMDAIMGQKASLRYLGAVPKATQTYAEKVFAQKAPLKLYREMVTEWINNEGFANARLNFLKTKYENIEVLSDNLKKEKQMENALFQSQSATDCSQIAEFEL